MRLIGTLPGESSAREFCDYLLTEKIDCHVEQGSDAAWQIWIEHDDAVERGSAEFAVYQANPTDARFAAAALAGKIRREKSQAAIQRQRNFRDVRTTVFTSPSGATPATVTLIFITVVLSALTGFGEKFNSPVLQAMLFRQQPTQMLTVVDTNGQRQDDQLLPNDRNSLIDIKHGQVWRLFTTMFVHFGLMHLVFNMMWLWRLGQEVERAKGSWHFIALVLTISLVCSCAQAGWDAYLDPVHFLPFGGMSGVNAGLFGYAWMCHRFRSYEHVHVTEYEVGLMVGWLVLCSTGFVGPIANAAHWGGLIVGMLIGYWPSMRRRASF